MRGFRPDVFAEVPPAVPALDLTTATEPANEDLRNALAVLICWRGRDLPQADAAAVERRIIRALAKLEAK